MIAVAQRHMQELEAWKVQIQQQGRILVSRGTETVLVSTSCFSPFFRGPAKMPGGYAK